MESATSRSSRPDSSKLARTFQVTSREKPSVAATCANEDRQLRARSSTRSTEQICATDAADKNTAVAVDELFQQNAPRIRARQLHRKNRASTKCHRSSRGEKFRATQPTATIQTTPRTP